MFNDYTQLNPPRVLEALVKATEAAGFTMSSDLYTGSLLRTLVASKPGGNFLELGTGTGVGTAWLLDGMDAAAHLTTVDGNEKTTAIAKQYLGGDARINFQRVDGRTFITTQPAESFDLIFADMPPGKFSLLDETLRLLKPGGFYVIDDLLPQPGWVEEHLPRVDELVATLEGKDTIRITKLGWSTGLLLAVKR